MVKTNYSLAPYHTFGLDVCAAQFINVSAESEIADVLTLTHRPRLILGSGSNMLFSKNYEGLVIRNVIQGIQVVARNQDAVIVEVGGGVIWHELVLWALANNFGGIENLSLIPGTVGAAPIQNIGAYGVEFDAVFFKLFAIEMDSGHLREFDRADCKFGYRNSIFKGSLKDKYFITRVQLKLTARKHHLSLQYGDIKNILSARGISSPTIQDISQAVIDIRTSKLPDPKLIGNAGSFFKNPVVSEERYENLRSAYPDIPAYPVGNAQKIPAAWMIERAGWKGFRKGDAGVYDKHALVLVNYGKATGEEMHHLAEAIRASVVEIFDIELESEVNLI